MKIFLLSPLLFLLPVAVAHAGEADVLSTEATKSGDGSYRFLVTVSHQDEGWQHYADKWEIVDATGAVLATRVLLHPHTGEQPFTRSLSGVRILENTDRVTVRAHDTVHNYGGRIVTVELPR